MDMQPIYTEKDRYFIDYILKNLPFSTFWKDKNLVFQGCNQRYAQQFGYADPKEIIGLTDNDLPGSPELRDKYINDDKQILTSGKGKLDYEEEQQQSDGSVITVLVSKVPIFDENNDAVGVLGVYSDITYRKKIEEQLKTALQQLEIANQVKSQFITNMEHDIRTPAAGIAMLSSVLASAEIDPAKKEKLSLLAKSAQQLLTILTEALNFNNVDAGKAQLLKKKFSLRRIVQNVVNLEIPAVTTKGLALESTIAADVPEVVIGDDFRMYRILLNLIGNSVKFTEKGSITVNISVAENKEQEIVIKLVISDTGIGIPKDKQGQIFGWSSPSQPGATTETRYIGSGLGLGVVKQFITKMGGEIAVESTPGVGTTFICLVPFKIKDFAQI